MQSPTPHRRTRKGFSLVEVVLAVGVLAVSVLAMMGMMGPSLSQVKTVTDSNVATAVISKVNSVIQSMSFDDVYQLVSKGNTGKSSYSNVGVLFFYTEEQNGELSRDRVSIDASGMGNTTNMGFTSYQDMANGASPSGSSEWRVTSPVIAVVISLSPMAKNIPNLNVSYQDASPYDNNTGKNMFPSYSMPAKDSMPYIPIMASVFTIPNLQQNLTGSSFSSTARDDVFTLNNRLFTFQTVKVR